MSELNYDKKDKLPIYYPVIILILVILIAVTAFFTTKKFMLKEPTVTPAESQLKALSDTITQNPNNAEVRSKLAYELQMLQEYDQAKEQYLEVLKTAPDDLATNYNLGVIAQAQSNDAETEKYFTKVLTIKPDHVLASYALGQIYLTQGKYDKVVEIMNRLLKTNPQNASLHSLKAQALEKLGDKKGAKTEYRTVLQYVPDDKEATEALERLK